jgi:hypothetical protein
LFNFSTSSVNSENCFWCEAMRLSPEKPICPRF